MKVLIAAASFASSISGIQRHAFNLVRCLLASAELSEVHLVVAPWQQHLLSVACLPVDSRLRTHVATMNRGSSSRNLWYLDRLPELAGQVDVDLVHLTYPMPLHAARFKCPILVTLHDMYPFEIPMNFGFPKFLFNQLVLSQCVQSVDAIACVSGTTRAQLKRFMPASVWRKSIYIPNCIEPEARETRKPPIPGWHGEPFLLCVAQHRKNKNIPLLIRAFEWLLRSGDIAPNAALTIIGMRGPESRKIDRLVRSMNLVPSIHFLEGLSEAELQWCYVNCEALVSPSITEGFGLPVAEGLMAGCRIVCSDIAAHREIGNGNCRYVSLRENAVEALAMAIAEILREPKNQPVPLPHFSAASIAKHYLALYRRLIASSTRKERTGAKSPLSLAPS